MGTITQRVACISACLGSWVLVGFRDAPQYSTTVTMNTLMNCSALLKNPDALTRKKNAAPTNHRELVPLTADPPHRHTMTTTGPHTPLLLSAPGSLNCLAPLTPHWQRPSPLR